jgi:hypothetical protein
MRYAMHALIIILPFILFTACDEDDPVTPQEEHFEAIGVVLTNSGMEVASILRGETEDTLYAQVGAISDHLEVKFYNEDEQIVDAPDDGEKTLSWEIGDTAVLEVHQDDGHDGEFEFHLKGLAAGTTTLELFIMHEGHADFRSGKFTVIVQ